MVEVAKQRGLHVFTRLQEVASEGADENPKVLFHVHVSFHRLGLERLVF
jgi:hypothetical protein